MRIGSDGAVQSLQGAVSDRLDHLSSRKVRFWAPFVLGLVMMGDSWDVGIIGYVMPSLRQEWGLTPLQIGAIISAGFAGQLVGALLFGPLAEKFGRMRVLNIAILVMSVLSIGCAMARNPDLFTVLRFAQGVGFGGAVPVCVSYINELAPTATRGRYFSLFQFLMVSGFALCGFVGAVVIPEYGWRAMFLIGAFPILLSPLIAFTLPESPRWLASLGRVEAMNRALAKLGAQPVDPGVGASVAPLAPRVPVSVLIAPGLRWLTLATCLLWFLTALVSYGFSTWTPTIYVDIFGLTLEKSLRYAAFTGVAYMLIPLVFAAVIDRFGRRPSGIVATASTLALLIVLALAGTRAPGLSVPLIALGWIASGASFTLLWPYSAEIFPTEIRSTALGLCSATARLGSTLTPLVVAGVLSATASISAVFVALAIPTFVMVLLWLFGSREMAKQRLDDPAAAPHP